MKRALTVLAMVGMSFTGLAVIAPAASATGCGSFCDEEGAQRVAEAWVAMAYKLTRILF